MGVLLALILSQNFGVPTGPIFSTPSTMRSISYAFSEFAPASGVGLPATACTCPASGVVKGANGEATVTTRAGPAECISNNGQVITQCASGTTRVSSGAVDSAWMGVWEEDTRTNVIFNSRDWSQAAWVKSNMTCARTAAGMRNADANGASTCTSSAANGTVLQTTVLGSTTFGASVYIKRRTGTGAVQPTVNGSTWLTDISSQLSSTIWKRLVPYETAGCTSTTAPTGSNCLVVPALAAAGANPIFGLRLATSGDAVDVDFGQLEASNNAAGDVTSPIETPAAASVARAVDYTDLVESLPTPAKICLGATVVGLPRQGKAMAGTIGNGTAGVAADSTIYFEPNSNPWSVNATFTSPSSYNSGIIPSNTNITHRYASYYDGALLDACVDGICGGGVLATWTPASFTRWRLGAFSAGLGETGHINGVIKQAQLDSDPSKCAGGYTGLPHFEMATASGAGMGPACSGVAAGTKSEALTVGRASTATCSKLGRSSTGYTPGDIATLAVNVARTEPNAAGRVAVRGEPQGTNLSWYSNAFTSLWSAISSGVAAPTIAVDYEISPTNVPDAERVQIAACPTLGNYSLVVQFQAAAFKVNPAMMSLFVKGTSGSGAITLYADDGATGYDFATCNFNASTYTACELPSTQGDLVEWGFGCINVSAGGSNTGAADVLVWNGQLENSTYRSNPIPTAGGAVTRAVETVVSTSVKLGSLSPSGCAAATFEPFTTSAVLDALLGGNTGRYLYLSPTLRTYDGTNNPSLASGFVVGTPKRYRTTWLGATMNLYNVTDATTTSSAFDGSMTDDGTLRLFGAVIGTGPGYLSDLQLSPDPARCQ